MPEPLPPLSSLPLACPKCEVKGLRIVGLHEWAWLTHVPACPASIAHMRPAVEEHVEAKCVRCGYVARHATADAGKP